MATALLFNSENTPAAQALPPLLSRLGIRARTVAPEEQGETIGSLCTADEKPAASPAAQGSFSDTMLVLHALSSVQLDSLLRAMREAGISIPLKAVVTEENATWTALRLHEELAREHRAMHGEKRQHPPRKHRKR